MEADGKHIWELLRPVVISTGPLKLLRRLSTCADVDGVLPEVVERCGPTHVLNRLGEPAPPNRVAEVAVEHLFDLVTPGKRLHARVRGVADVIALEIFDAWATLGDDPGAGVAGDVIEALGIKLARMAFDAGGPGSGQVLSAWKVRNRIFLVGEDGAYAIYDRLTEVLEEWIFQFKNADIECAGLKRKELKALGLVPNRGLDSSWNVRINGVWWKVTDSRAGV
jgi:hypothetical protein